VGVVLGRSNHSFEANGQVQTIHCARLGRDDRHLGSKRHFGEVTVAGDPHGLVQLHVPRHGNHGHTANSGVGAVGLQDVVWRILVRLLLSPEPPLISLAA
jgi:hypothetical protein